MSGLSVPTIIQVIAPTFPLWKVFAQESEPNLCFASRVHLLVVHEQLSIPDGGRIDRELVNTYLAEDMPRIRGTGIFAATLSDIQDGMWSLEESSNFIGMSDIDPALEWTYWKVLAEKTLNGRAKRKSAERSAESVS